MGFDKKLLNISFYFFHILHMVKAGFWYFGINGECKFVFEISADFRMEDEGF